MNAVLTIATNFKQPAINRFVKSFREFNTADKVIIVINQKDVNNNYEFLKNAKDRWGIDWRVVDDSYLFNKYYIISERFKFFTQILEGESVDKVFLCDCRDVLFQNDIFNQINKTTFFLEPEFIINEPFNTFTVRHVDHNIFEQIKHKNIICAGTIIGPKDQIMNITQNLTTEISRIKILLNEVGNPYNFDQALLNILVYGKNILNGEYTLSGNRDGIVNTIGLSSSFRKIDNGFFYNENGIRPAVVHQFDRCDKRILEQLRLRDLDVEDLL